ncbi:MAG: histidine kinase [Bacteroidota bacterium]
MMKLNYNDYLTRSSGTKSIFKRVVAYILVGIGVGFITCSPCMMDLWLGLENTLFCTAVTVLMWEGNGRISWWLDQKITWVDQPGKRTVIGVVLMSIYSGTAAVLWAIFFYSVVRGYALEQYQDGLWNVLWYSIIITAFITMILHSRGFLLQWRETALREEKLKRAQLTSQFQSLKDQLNPHFLFNSLNALSSLVYQDPDKAAAFIKELSQIYRYILEYADKEVVALEEEVKCVKAYLYLQGIRFGKNILVNINIPENVFFQIPPLSLQMLLENVVKHNIISSRKPVTIDIFLENNDTLVVRNTYQPKQHHKEVSTGVGLTNIQSRYAHLTDREVHILESDDYFTVKLPLLTLSYA